MAPIEVVSRVAESEARRADHFVAPNKVAGAVGGGSANPSGPEAPTVPAKPEPPAAAAALDRAAAAVAATCGFAIVAGAAAGGTGGGGGGGAGGGELLPKPMLLLASVKFCVARFLFGREGLALVSGLEVLADRLRDAGLLREFRVVRNRFHEAMLTAALRRHGHRAGFAL